MNACLYKDVGSAEIVKAQFTKLVRDSLNQTNLIAIVSPHLVGLLELNA
jgi:hypothetical protein